MPSAVIVTMGKAVQFDRYGDVDVLEVRDVPRPQPGAGEVLVEVKAAGINPGEAMIRSGALDDRWPATFPSGQGSDLAGVVTEIGPDAAGFAIGDEVFGFVENRSSQAEYVSVPVGQLVAKPAGVPWEVAGALHVAGATAWAAVNAVGLKHGDTVAVSGAAGGVGTIAVQLARRAGATVLGIAGPANDAWLTEHGVVPVNYGDGLAERLRAAAPSGGQERSDQGNGSGIDAFLDFFGGRYVALAVDELGVAPGRVDTVIDFAAIEQFGVQSAGNAQGANPEVLTELAGLVADGELDVPIAEVVPLADVRRAYRTLEQRHTRGKIVLRPQ